MGPAHVAWAYPPCSGLVRPAASSFAGGRPVARAVPLPARKGKSLGLQAGAKLSAAAGSLDRKLESVCEEAAALIREGLDKVTLADLAGGGS